MFGYKAPEKMGIASGNIEKYLRKLEARRLSTHDVIIMRGENIVFENYWQPFDKDFMHRMYSVSKSILSIAVGFAILSTPYFWEMLGREFPSPLAQAREK